MLRACLFAVILTYHQIDASDIAATISADGTVSFFDSPVSVSKTQMDVVLREAQAQSVRLIALEREIAASKEFLSKASSLPYFPFLYILEKLTIRHYPPMSVIGCEVQR
jgi:hypothetical protein